MKLLTLSRFAPPPRLIVVTAWVVAAHAAGLWWLQHSMATRKPAPPLVPTQVIPVQLLAPSAAPSSAPARPAQPLSLPTPLQATPRPATPRPPTLARPAAAPTMEPTPSRTAPVDSTSFNAVAITNSSTAATTSPSYSTDSASSAPNAHPAGGSGASAPAMGTPHIELPSTQADYLRNPPPPYPPLSKRLGEQGRVILRVRIEADGSASEVHIHRSSGFARLDQSAQHTVLRWRFVPGTRNGVPEAMWFHIPIHFVLE